jgi:hypothetical protein
LASLLPYLPVERQVDVSQRSIEILIGRLITDEAFRSVFLQHPKSAIETFVEGGHELTPIEIDAIATVAHEFWYFAAAEIGPRLQKASLSIVKR